MFLKRIINTEEDSNIDFKIQIRISHENLNKLKN